MERRPRRRGIEMIIEIKVDGEDLIPSAEVTEFVIGLKTPKGRMVVISDGNKKVCRSLGRYITKESTED